MKTLSNQAALIMLLSVGASANVLAQENQQSLMMEEASVAVANMRVGWNVGNALESNSGDVNNMWIEQWTGKAPSDYEKAWGQQPTTRKLIRMFKKAGFNAIRVPVTWYPHYGKMNNSGLTWDVSKWSGYAVDRAWMARVKQVVDYVMDEGMYCILNVHHDTGEASTAWVRADVESHEKYQERFTRLWTAVAEQFKDYDSHLLFEGYNEMLDKYGSWCFASYASPARYDSDDAADAYRSVNAYAQDFVDAVRATGGNNAERNLIVNTYGACCGAGSWNTHLQDPLKSMAMPEDKAKGHIIFQVHSYWDTNNFDASMKRNITAMFGYLDRYLVKKHGAPVIMGEWGTDSKDFDYSNEVQRGKMVDFAEYFQSQAKKKGVACFYWMHLSDGADRAKPAWTMPELRDAIIKGFYGEGGFDTGVESVKESDGDRSSSAYFSGSSSFYNMNGLKVDKPDGGVVVVKNKGKVRKVKL